MTIEEIQSHVNDTAPFSLQESYDNSGLLIGESKKKIEAVLITLDVTNEVIEEAEKKGCNLIISHHPLIFGGLKSLTGKNDVEEWVIKCIKKDIAVLAVHTNLDNANKGVNFKIAEKLGLESISVMSPINDSLRKISVFIPEGHVDAVRNVIFKAGAGRIGEYDFCSFNSEGTGTFRPGDNSDPFVGKKGEIHYEREIKSEIIVPKEILRNVEKKMIKAHPYEEPAYDIFPVENLNPLNGSGIIAKTKNSLKEEDFLSNLKEIFGSKIIRHSPLRNKQIKKVAICGGSGSFLIRNAKYFKADIFITADIKYHQFFEAEGDIVLADIGHYESEQFTKDLIYEIINKKNVNFAVHLSEVNTNPVNYF